MPSNHTLSALISLEPSLRAQGVCGLYLFGSHARDAATSESDIDLMFDIEHKTKFSLFDQARIARQLSEKLNARVDLVPRRSLHPLVKLRVEHERVMIFN